MKNFVFSILAFCGLLLTNTQLHAQNAALSPGNIVACNTTIYDRAGASTNYANNTNEWITVAGRPGATITISGSYTLEACSCDYIYVRSGYGNTGAIYVTKTNGSGTVSYTGAVGETLTVHLTSDGSTRAAGFAFTVTYSTTQTCPTTYNLSGTATSVACGSNYIVKDHAGDNTSYSNSRTDYMVFNGVSGSTAVLNIVGKYATESGYDYLRVFQGSGTGGTIVYGPLSGTGDFNFTGTAGVTYTLQFTSDASTVNSGFSLFAYYTGSCIACTTPTTSYTVTGGGSYCSGGSGVPVGLSGSQSGVTYQLFNGASAVGSTVAGTGSGISFGNQTAAGTYTVKSTTAGGYCATSMTGSQTITVTPIPYTPAAITGASSVCVGASTTFTSASPSATGGTITSVGTTPNKYNICTFNGSGTFTVPAGVTLIGDVLAVGGGGGGGANGGGGGGGGGVNYSTTVSIPAGGNTVTVGSGGTCCGSPAGNGGTSSLGALVVADGGGGGASRDAGAGGQTGGSGGGGAGATASPRHLGGAAGTNGTASAGGNGTTPDPGCNAAGGGGGGAGGAGSTASNNAAGNGGVGIANSITGSSVFYGGGGGGGTTNFLGCGISTTVLIPSSGNNAVTCGVNSTICANLGCGSGYSSDNDGYTVVNASGTATISISGTYDLEPGYDYMYIYSGIGTGGTLLYTYNGYGGTITSFTGTPGQSYTIRLTSDVSLSGTGVSLNVTYSGACTPAWTNGTGGNGGGSNGESGVNGTANTGGGGGAETAGGSGVVVIRYPAGSWRSGDNSIATVDASGNVTGVAAGTTSIYYDIIAGSCTTSVSKSITVNANPTANAGGALSAICQSATSAAMGGSVGGSASGGTWSGGAGTWTNASNPSTATYTAGASESGSITLTLTTSGGSCGTTTATKSITVNPNPTANAGGALSAICQSGTSAAMGGSVGGGATGGTWSGGVGTWTNANNPATATYTAGASESGSITLTLTTSGGACGTTTATKSITVDASPTTALAGSDQANCNNSSFTLAGNTPTVGTGAWSLVSGTATITTPSANNSGVTGVTLGTSATLRWTISNGSCTASTDDVVISNNAGASVPTSGGDQEACYRASVPNLTATVGGGETIDWYDASSGGTLIKSGSLNINEAADVSGPNPTPGTYTYYAQGRNTTSGCTSSSRTSVTLTIRAVPIIAPSATPSTACSGDNVTLNANASAGAGTITSYAWSSGLGAVSGGTVNPTSTTTYTVTVENSYTCTNDASIGVTIKSASGFVVLPSSTTTTMVEQCTDGGWTYYANASTPDDWAFAIRKNGNTFTAQVDITVLGSTIDNINTSKPGYEHGSYLMKRYWDASILSGSISSSVDVKFFYDPSEKTDALSARDAAWTPYSATASKTSFRWFKTVGASFGSVISTIDGNSFNGFSNITLTESASGTENGITYAQFNGITSFSGGTGGFGFSSPGTGLPVKLLYFTASTVDNNYIKLDWSTSLEIDNKGFDIERSTDGIRFDKIGWVDGHGNATQNIVYSFNDKTAQANTVYYYRLKQIDFDADVEYSNIVSAAFKDGKGFTQADLYPNPATNKVVISVATDIAQDAKIKIFDLLGQPVLVNDVKLVSGSNNFELDLTDFSGGTYTVSIFSGNQYITKKLVISK